MNKNHFYIFIIFSFILNFILKLFKIDSMPYSYDEIISVKDTLLDFGHIKHESEWDSNPPFYYYCLWIWEKIFGLSELGIRSFSVTFNSLTIVTLGFYLKKHFDYITAIFFSIIYIFHPTLLNYAQEARCYSLLIFLISLSIICFHNFILNNNKINLIILGLINFLLIYTHYIAALIIPFQFLFILLFYKKHIINNIIAGLITLFLISLRFTKKQFELIIGVTSDSIKETWIKKATFSNLLDFLNTMYFSYVFFLLILLSILYVLNKERKVITNSKNILYYFIFIAAFVPLSFYIIGAITPIFINRYILFTVPFFIIITAYLITKLNKLGFILLIVILSFEIYNLKFGVSKGINFKSVASYTKKFKNKPLVIINKKDVTELFIFYYDIELFKKIKYNSKTDLNALNIFDANTAQEIKEINLIDQKTILLFQTFDTETENIKINEWFKLNNYKNSKYNLFEGVKFTLFQKN